MDRLPPTVLARARLIGRGLEELYPRTVDYTNSFHLVPAEHVEAIADAITLVVAEILQAWLDAGSERDVTLEELGPAIRDHVKGWSEE